MNRAWDALLGLAALGAAAVAYDARPIDWPDGPVYVTESAPLSASACRGWQSRAQRRAAAGFAGSWEAFEGFSRLQGACHPQDQDRGRALIEAAIAKGAGRYLMVEYVMALRAVGDSGRAEQQLPLAAETMRFLLETQIALLLTWRLPIVFDAMNEIETLDRSRDWDILQRRLDHLLGRPPLLPEEESKQIFRITGRMGTIDYPAALFQEDRAWRTGKYRVSNGERFVSLAASCGHPESIREYAQRMLNGELQSSRQWSVVAYVMWLNSRTGAEGELLDTLLARFDFVPRDSTEQVERLNRRVATQCQPRPERHTAR
ncbi:MAG: hypothetical protein NBV67_18185 [Tagaea sp.]|nr:hypothetical protein [Tagaea sp.]